MKTADIIKIDKSQLHAINFRRADVLPNREERASRNRELRRSMSLGNLYKVPVRIQFENNRKERMETEATVWAVTEKNVSLKSGVTIPIHAIANIS